MPLALNYRDMGCTECEMVWRDVVSMDFGARKYVSTHYDTTSLSLLLSFLFDFFLALLDLVLTISLDRLSRNHKNEWPGGAILPTFSLLFFCGEPKRISLRYVRVWIIFLLLLHYVVSVPSYTTHQIIVWRNFWIFWECLRSRYVPSIICTHTHTHKN